MARRLGRRGGAAAAGAASGGLIGSMVSAGVLKENAEIYAEGVRRGGTLVTVRASGHNQVSKVEAIMRKYNPVDPAKRRQGVSYRDSGWTQFDPAAAPYDIAEIEREQARYR